MSYNEEQRAEAIWQGIPHVSLERVQPDGPGMFRFHNVSERPDLFSKRKLDQTKDVKQVKEVKQGKKNLKRKREEKQESPTTLADFYLKQVSDFVHGFDQNSTVSFEKYYRQLLVYRVTPQGERPCPPCTGKKKKQVTHKSNCGMISLNPATGSVSYFCFWSELSTDMGVMPGFICSPDIDLQYEQEVEESFDNSETGKAMYYLKIFGSKFQVLEDESVLEFSKEKLWKPRNEKDMPSTLQFSMVQHFERLKKAAEKKVDEARKQGNEERLTFLLRRASWLGQIGQEWNSQRKCNAIWSLVRAKLREKTRDSNFEKKLDMDPDWFPCKMETTDKSGKVVNVTGWEVNWQTGLVRKRTDQSMWSYESPAAIPRELLLESKTNADEFFVDWKRGHVQVSLNRRTTNAVITHSKMLALSWTTSSTHMRNTGPCSDGSVAVSLSTWPTSTGYICTATPMRVRAGYLKSSRTCSGRQTRP